MIRGSIATLAAVLVTASGVQFANTVDLDLNDRAIEVDGEYGAGDRYSYSDTAPEEEKDVAIALTFEELEAHADGESEHDHEIVDLSGDGAEKPADEVAEDSETVEEKPVQPKVEVKPTTPVKVEKKSVAKPTATPTGNQSTTVVRKEAEYHKEFTIERASDYQSTEQYLQNGYVFDEVLRPVNNGGEAVRTRGILYFVKTIDGKETILKELRTSRLLGDSGVRYRHSDKTSIPVNKTAVYTLRFELTDTRWERTGEWFESVSVQVKNPGPKYTGGIKSNLGNKTYTITKTKNHELWMNTTLVKGMGRDVVLQRYNTSSKKWVTVRAGKYSASTGKSTATILKTDAAGKYRMHLPETKIQKAFTSTFANIKFGKSKATIRTYSADRYKYFVRSTNTIKFHVGDFDQKKGQRLIFQRYAPTQKKWITTATVKNPKPGYHSFRTLWGSAYTKTQKNSYRLVFGGTADYWQTTSKSVYTWIENSRYYTGLKKEYYNYYKGKCSSVVPQIDSSLKSRGVAGLAKLYDRVSVFSPHIAKHHRKTVALHECAHHKQYFVASKYGNWSKFRAESSKQLRGERAMEWLADCVANRWAKNSYWGYKNPSVCNTAAGKKWTDRIIKGKNPWA